MPPRKKTQKMDESGKPIIGDGKTEVHSVLDGHPLDAAHAFNKALTQICGKGLWDGVSYWEENAWGGKRLRRPTNIRVPTGVQTTESIVWGRIEAPTVFKGFLWLNVGHKRKRACLEINGEIDKESNEAVQKIITRTELLIKEASIFRGKAIHLVQMDSTMTAFGPVVDMFGTFPRFLNLTDVRPEELRYPAATMNTIEKTLFTPVQKSMACRQAGVPLKRGILLEGTYGVGKTLCAFVLAKKAVENGWTYVYLDDVDRLEEGVDFARHYQPCVLYGEDIDQAHGIHERSAKGNRILNALDSIESKNSEMIVVLTTNHLQGITPALLRPGRMDAVIHIPPPDAKTVEVLLRQYARGLIPADEKLGYVAMQLDKHIPAVIREVVERAKLHAIARDGAAGNITELDLLREAEGMVEHVRLAETIQEPERLSDREKAARIRANAVLKAADPKRAAEAVFGA